MRYLEDFVVGESFELGSRTVTEAEIVAFAREYDPQGIHTDRERAKASIHGGLIASGWHTIGIFMRLAVDSFYGDTANMGAPGVDALRWLRPVRPGDTLSARLTIMEVTPSRSRPDRGIMRSRAEVTNQDGETVLTMEIPAFFGRRPEVAGGEQ